MICDLCGGSGMVGRDRCAQCQGDGEKMKNDITARRIFNVSIIGTVGAPLKNDPGIASINFMLEVSEASGLDFGSPELLQILAFVNDFINVEAQKVITEMSTERTVN